ncbi:hypothetical protein [Kiloniella laminariae]|uniref:hypothetical protein n=1 Tax=Kiloniella laminariae TaxID=454162 RepID=UPI001B7FB0D1|nr:hypothetical protein [Kiloniella laminariae]
MEKVIETLRDVGTSSYLNLSKQPFLVGELSSNSLFFARKHPDIFQDNQGVLEIKPGVHDIDFPINLDGSLLIQPGTTLNFSANSYLLVRGALTALGSSDAPVVLRGQKDQLWKGIYVHDAGNLSELDHVIISDTTAFEDGYLKLTGGVTFYKSALKITNSDFKNSVAEDGLNIINSEFSLAHTRFENMRSDALDSDFSQGSINNGVFHTIGGDAIDLSGTRSWIQSPQITSVHDKAISAGENSTVDVIGGSVRSVGVAAASKDGSLVKISETRIDDVTLFGLMTYIKKSSYSFPTLEAHNLFWGEGSAGPAANNWIRQAGTVLTVDGHNVVEETVDVKALYKGAVMSK